MLLNLTQAAAPTTHVISSQPKGILNKWGKQSGAYFASVRGFRYLTNADALAHTNATEIFDLASARQHLDNDALTYGATYYYRIGVVDIFDNLSVLSAVKSAAYMQIQSAEIASVDAAKLTSGTIPDARIVTIDASKLLSGTIPEARIATLDAAKILSGTIPEARIATLAATKLTGTIDLNRFPSTAKPIEIFATVAAAGTATPEGRVIFVQADDKLYRATGSAWTAATDGADIVANTFTGGKIIAGTITSTELAADSVTAKQLVVTDWTNLFVNPQFAGGSTDGWRVTNGNTMVAVAKAGSVAPISTIPNAYAVQMGSVASSSDAIGLDWISVREGDEFFYEFDYAASSDATGTFQAIMRSKTAAGVEAPISIGTLTLSTTWQTLTGTYTVPAGVVQIYAGMRSGGGGVGSLFGTNFRFNRRANGELIVDGSITANKIVAGSINTTHLAANSVTAKQLVVVDLENLIPDFNFDQSAFADVWDFSNANIPGTPYFWLWNGDSQTGKQVLALDNLVTGGTAGLQLWIMSKDFIPVTAGSVLAWEISRRTTDASSTNGLYYRINWYDRTGTALASPYTDAVSAGSIPAAWTVSEGQVSVPAGATYAKVRIFHVSSSGTRYLLLDRVSLRKTNNATLIVDGSITTNKLVAGSVTAAKIGAGEISASKIAVGAISDNLILDADFESGTTDLWPNSGGTRTIDTTAGPPSGKNSLKLDRGVTNNTVSMNATYNRVTPVEAGDTYYFEYTIKGSSASGAGAYLRVLYYTDAMVAASPAYVDIYNNGSFTTDWAVKKGTAVIPLNVKYMRVQLYHHSTSTAQSLWVSSVMAKKLITGELIVNGSIHGDKITAGTITADKIDVTDLVVGTLNLAGESVSPSKFAARDFTSQIVDTEMSDFNCWYWYDASMANATRPTAKAANVYGIGSSRFLMYFNKAGISTAYTVQYASTMADISVEANIAYLFSVGVGEGVGGAPASPATAYDMLIDWYTVDSAGVPNSLISTTTVSLATAATTFAQYTTIQTSPTGAQVCRMRIKATRSTAGTFWSTIIGSPAIRRRITRVQIEPNTINETFFAADNITQTMTAGVNKTMVSVTCDHGSACNLVDIVASFRNNSGIVKTMDVQITNASGVVIEEWTGFNLGDGAMMTFSTSDINPIGTSTGYWLRATYTSTGAAIRAHIRATARRR